MQVDCFTEGGLEELNKHFAEKSYIEGNQASLDDLTVFSAMKGKSPDATKLPNVARWYTHIEALVNQTFPGKAAGVKLGAKNQPKKEKKEKKAEPPKKEPKPEPTPEELAAKKKKAVFKEGGKKGQDIAGVYDMGGLEFFCTNMCEPDGDPDLLWHAMDGANVKVEDGAEERKGGSDHVGKMLFSSGIGALALMSYVPDDKLTKIDPKDWMEHTCKMTAGDKAIFHKSDKNHVCAYIKLDADNNLFPLKMKDVALAQAIAYLRERDCFPPDEESDDDDMVFGDDTDFDAL